MTIEERASDYFHELLSNEKDLSHAIDANKAYIKGATDQRKIDINKACEWLSKYARDYAEIAPLGKDDVYALVYDFRKAMEE